jgi:hypothetical protein
MHDGHTMEEMDPGSAAELLRQSAHHARARLTANQPLIYAAWGVAWLAGCGAMWLSVLGQHPFRGAAAWAVAILGAGGGTAGAVTAISAARASRGIGGVSARQGAIFGIAWPVGFASLFMIIGAAWHFGAGPKVTGILGATGSLLVVGLIYVLAAGMWMDWVMFWVGMWLLLVASAGAWTGPVGSLLADAVAGGGGFLLTASWLAWRTRPGRA